MFNTHFVNYPKSDNFKVIFNHLGIDVFNINDDLWKYQRKMVHARINNLEFQSSIAKRSKENIVSMLLPLLDMIESKERVINLHDVFDKFMFDVTCHLVLGVDPCNLALDFSVVLIATAMDLTP